MKGAESNNEATGPEVRELTPNMSADFADKLRRVLVSSSTGTASDLAFELRRHAHCMPMGADEDEWRAITLLLADLVEQDWIVLVQAARLFVSPPAFDRLSGETAADVKNRIRRHLRLARDRQMTEQSVQAFLRKAERQPAVHASPASVLRLVDDGNDLADQFERIRALPDDQRESGLAKLIRPEIQVCSVDEVCKFTGKKTLDIWRYFRHTWSLEYRPIPGRQMPVLIRNAARPNHPVMGIAMLASPAMRLAVRDRWIGWRRDALEEQILAGYLNPQQLPKLLLAAINRGIKAIRWDDLLTSAEVRKPTERAIVRMEQQAVAAESRRNKMLQKRQTNATGTTDLRALPSTSDGATDWQAASQDHLFVRKRAQTLAKLLDAKRLILKARSEAPDHRAFDALASAHRGRAAIEVALQEIRKENLASRVADVSVCGAIAPYNELLGGKLVALAMASRDVRRIYRQRYGGQVSHIASQMAGTSLERSAELLVLTTTSLYGLGSSQYNRLALRAADHPELDHDIEWKMLERSSGFGSVHVTAETVGALKAVASKIHSAVRVNNVFGEGSSPRLRQIREGVEAMGIKSDSVLRHSTPRLVYGCELIPGARDRMLGIPGDRERYSVPTIQQVSAAWRRRWLAQRIMRDDVLDRLRTRGPDTIRTQLWADEYGQFRLPFQYAD